MKILLYCGIHNLVNFSRIRPYYDICYGFDANLEKIEQARKAYINDPNVRIIYGALTEKGGEEVEFVITDDWTPASSLGKPNPEFEHMKTGLLTAQTKVKVPTINLHDFCKTNGILEIDTLITDLQGIDLTVLKTLSEMIRQGKIREIQCEVEPDQTPPRYLDIPTSKLSEFNRLLSEKYDVLWMDPPGPPEDAWEMDVRWRVKGGEPPDDIEFVMENEMLVAKIGANSSLASYSQYGEDIVLNALFAGKRDGFYVDVGANDPDEISNTKLFYLRGWHGINIEPEAALYEKLCQKRERDINLRVGVGPDSGVMTFYKMSSHHLSSFNKEAALKAGVLYNARLISEEPVPVVKLSDILEKHLSGTVIDFLSVDAEGYDLAVLQSNDWCRYRPSVIIVEINVGGEEIITFLQNLDYVLIFDNRTNGIFVSRSFLGAMDERVLENLTDIDKKYNLETFLPCSETKSHLTINFVYEFMNQADTHAAHRGNVSVLWSNFPVEGCDAYVYTNAFSYKGKKDGIDILLMLEPVVVLPGEYDPRIWNHFDHILGTFDTLTTQVRHYHKILFPRADIAGKSPVTDIQDRREVLYPIAGRKNAICMIGSNRSSHVPYELYSRRVDAARWFAEHSQIPFDVYGTPFDLPNYRGPCPVPQKLSVLQQYRYNLCFENTNHPILSAGYVTEKILDCLETRTVPIYLGASNIEEYVPPECFIDFRKFADFRELDAYLNSMSQTQYRTYIDHIDAFVCGGGLKKFSETALCNKIIDILIGKKLMDSGRFNDHLVWRAGISPSVRKTEWNVSNQPVMWTWNHLSKAEPPALEGGKIRDPRPHMRAVAPVSKDPRGPKSFLIAPKASIRILAAGTKFYLGNARYGYDYGWRNLFDALQRFKNVEVQFFDYATQAQQRGIAGMSEYLEDIVNKEKPDMLFYSPTNLFAGVLPDSLQYIASHTDTQTVIWPGIHGKLTTSELNLCAPCADFFIATSSESEQEFRKAGLGSKLIKSQWGFNPFTYAPKPSLRFRNISFCGTAKDNRAAILEKMKQYGLPVDVFGPGWHENSLIPLNDMVSIFNQSRINLNIGSTPDWSTANINRRIFEVPGCGGFLLTTPCDHLEEYYEPGKEVIVASSLEELIDKTKYYLVHEEERRKIAARGNRRTLAEHTWSHRLADIFKHIGFQAVSPALPQTVSSTANHFTASADEENLPSADVVLPPADDSDRYGNMTTVWVMAFNQLQYTKQCVESILHYTKAPYELLLVDHGSTDGTFEYFNWIKSFHPDTRIVKYFQNRIIEETCNHIFCIARGKYLAVATNDTVVHEGWLENFITHIESAPDIAVVGPRSNNISGPQMAPTDYNSLEAYQTFALEWSQQHRGENFPIDRMVGMCMLTKKEVYYRIGGGDPDLPTNGRDGGYGFSDDDFTLRLRLGKYRTLVANDVFIHHYGSVTVKLHRPDLFGEPQNVNKAKYIRKVQHNERITIGTDGKMILRPFNENEVIPIDERLVIRSPQMYFVETADHDAASPDAAHSYTELARKYKGEHLRCAKETIPDIILKCLEGKRYDFMVLIDSRFSPSYENISSLAEYAICYPDVAIMVPVGNYAPATHRTAGTEKGAERIEHADLSVCVLNLKIIRRLSKGFKQCKSADDLFWFMQRRARGDGYFIAKANDIVVYSSATAAAHPYDSRDLPEQLIKLKKYAQAVAIYEEDLRKDSTFAHAYYQLACIAGKRRQTEEAIRLAEQALEADPHHIETLVFLSGLFMDQKEWKRAESFIRQANFKQPGNPDVQKIVERYEKALKENSDLFKTDEFFRTPVLDNIEYVKDRTSIIVATASRHAIECLKAIKNHTKEPYELIVVDAITSPDLKKMFKKTIQEHPSHKILDHSFNTPILPLINKAINTSTGEYIVLLSEDSVVTDGWLSGMLSCLNHAYNPGIVGAMTNRGSDIQQAAKTDYQFPQQLDQHAAEYKERYKHRRIPCRDVDRFCMMFRRSLAEDIGLYDQRFEATHLEHEDYCLRAVLEGHQNYIAGDVFIHRQESKEEPVDRRPLEKKWTLSMGTPEGKKLAVFKAKNIAGLMHAKGETDQAFEALVHCIKFMPDKDEIYYELSRIFIESGKFSEVWEVYGTMPEAVKNNFKGLEYAAYAKEGLGLDQEAAALADKILSLNQASAEAYNLKGILAYKKGEADSARNYFKKAIHSDPGFGNAYTNLGVLCWREDKKGEAVKNIRQGFILSPTVPDNSSIYHSVLSSQDLLNEAEGNFREAYRLYPRHKNICFLYIDILIRQNKLDEAMLRIEDALATFGLNEGFLSAALSIREKIGPRCIEKPSKKGTLSVCLIVKNEEAHLIKCLRSIRDVADEIIVVDTGSTDKTVQIAKVFGARLFEFPWTGNFSEARNRSLSEATGDWIFVLDADEVISPVDYNTLKLITGNPPKSPAAYAIETRNYLTNEFIVGWTPYDGKYPEESRLGWIPSTKVRLFTRRKDVFFTNPVHELLEPSLQKAQIPIYPGNVVVHHYGKLDDAKDAQKGEDYYLLGKIKYENDPTNVKHMLELAKQAQLLSKDEEAIELLQKALSIIGSDPESQIYQEIARISYGEPISEIYTFIAVSYLHLQRFDDALAAGRKSMETKLKRKEHVNIYAECEIVGGSAEKALPLLEEQLSLMPEYTPAVILKAIAFCMEEKTEDFSELIPALRQKQAQAAAVFNMLARRLKQNKRKDKALLLMNTAIANNLINVETNKIMHDINAD